MFLLIIRIAIWIINTRIVATDDAPSCEDPSGRQTIKPPAWQKDYLLF